MHARAFVADRGGYRGPSRVREWFAVARREGVDALATAALAVDTDHQRVRMRMSARGPQPRLSVLRLQILSTLVAVSRAYSPAKFGGRFSNMALIPSLR